MHLYLSVDGVVYVIVCAVFVLVVVVYVVFIVVVVIVVFFRCSSLLMGDYMCVNMHTRMEMYAYKRRCTCMRMSLCESVFTI